VTIGVSAKVTVIIVEERPGAWLAFPDPDGVGVAFVGLTEQIKKHAELIEQIKKHAARVLDRVANAANQAGVPCDDAAEPVCGRAAVSHAARALSCRHLAGSLGGRYRHRSSGHAGISLRSKPDWRLSCVSEDAGIKPRAFYQANPDFGDDAGASARWMAPGAPRYPSDPAAPFIIARHFCPQFIRQLERFADVRRKQTFRERSDDG